MADGAFLSCLLYSSLFLTQLLVFKRIFQEAAEHYQVTFATGVKRRKIGSPFNLTLFLPWFWQVVTWRDRREGPSSIVRLGPSYTIAEFNRRVNLRFCIDHRIAMAKKWRVKESEWILAGVFKKMRCDLFCSLFFFSSKIYLTLTYSYFEKYYWLPPLILNGKTTWGDKLFFFTNIKTDGFETYDKVLLK